MNSIVETASVDADLPDQQELESLVSDILDEAKRQGATAAEAAVSVDTGLSVTVRLGDVETLEYHRDRGLGVTVYFGNRKGSASTSDFGPGAVRETVEAACAIARHTSEDPCAGLADPERLAKEIPDLELCHPWPIDAEQAIDIARACEDAARAEDARITNSEGATVNTHQGMRVYGNSHGFIGGYPSTRHSLSCAVLGAQDGDMERDYWYTVARRPDALQTPQDVGRVAAQRTVHRLGARKLATCQVPVVYAPEVATGLIGHFIGAIRGGSLYRKSSFLVDSLGSQVFPDFMHLHEAPHLRAALGSAPFDSEGVATRPRDIVAGGVVRGYVLDTYSACKLGMETTGNAGGVHNLIVEPGDRDLAGILAEMGTGLMVTELMGQGLNMVTGDYSRGAAGYWVENGEIRYPVHEITVAGNLRDMFRNIVTIGTDIDTRGNIRCGSILIAGMTVAGE